MRESRTPGSERGVPSNEHSYRNNRSIPGLRRSRKLPVAVVETRHSQSDQVATATNIAG